MRAVVQRAASGRVTVAGEEVGALARPGLVVLVAIGNEDTPADAETLASKLWRLRILKDAEGRMNRSCEELAAPLLVVSQFTLYGDTSRGRRPSFAAAMAGDAARHLFEELVSCLRRFGATVSTGIFGAHMVLELANDGPVTLLLDVGDRPDSSSSR